MVRCPILVIAVMAAVAATLPGAVLAGDLDSRVPEPLRIKDFLYNIDKGLKFGPVHLHGYLTEHASYNTNLFLEENSPNADFLFDTLGGARLDFRYGRAKGHILGEVEYVKTVATGTYDHLNARAVIEAELNSRWAYLEFWERFRYEELAENLIAPAGTDKDVRNFISFVTNDVGLQGGLRLARLGLELSGGLVYWLFQKDRHSYMNHMEIPASLKISYNWRKLRMFLTGDFGMVDFTGEYTDTTAGKTYRMNDYMYYGGQLGFSYELTGKLNLFLSGGIRMQDLGEERTGTVKDENSYTGFVANFSINYKMSPKVTMGMNYYRRLEFSGTSNYQTTDFASVYYRHEILPRFSAKISPRFMYVDPSASMSNTFMIMGGYVLLDYRLWEWFSAGLRYDFRMRTASASGGSPAAQNYMAHLVALTLTAYF